MERLLSIAIFGRMQLASPADVFTINQASTADSSQLIKKSLKREIDRLQGYKTNLTPAESKRLAKLQTDIQRIKENAGPDGLSLEQRDERAELYRQANDILGKPYVDVEADPELSALVKQVDTLLETQYRGPTKKRLENLRALEGKFYDAYFAGNSSATLARQIANVKTQITRLAAPRPMDALSASERRDYDALVEKVNARAGYEYLMPSRKRARAESLQKTMNSM